MILISSVRKKIAQNLKAAAIPGVGDNVFPSRSRKVWPAEGDVLLVYTQETSTDDEDTAPTIYKATTTVVVQIVAQETDDEDDENDAQEEALETRVDTITEAVVRVLQAAHGITGPLDGLVDWLRWKGLRPMLSSEGEILRNSRQILFSAEWSIDLPDTQPVDDFLRTGTELGAPTGAKVPALDATFTTDMRAP